MEEIHESRIDNRLEPGRSISNGEVRSELERILGSKTFRAARGQKKFLAYAVEEVLAGRAPQLKEYVIATEALGRESSFDPRLDPIVRTEARKLRARLAKYYESEGSGNPLRIEFRKGSYAPAFCDSAESAKEEPDEPPISIPIEVQPVAAAAPPPAPVSSPNFVICRLLLGRSRRMFASFALVLLVLAAAGGSYHFARSGFSQPIFAANDASIAVLPFTNLSDNSEEFLSDGLTEELIDNLREVPGLRVVARSSVFRFKGKAPQIREIDKQLHVRAVLVGTLSKSDNRLKVTLQLNDAQSGYHLWSGSYERDSNSIGTILPEIASAVTNVLGVGAVASAQDQSRSTPAPNGEAHEDYLRGLYFRNRYTVDALNKAIGYFKRAIAEDPSYAQAYAGLADCYAMARPVAATQPLEVIPKIRAAASKAIALDGRLGEPHVDLAVTAEYEYDWATAEREFKKGLQLSPSNVMGHVWYAWYLELVGRSEEALTQRAIAAKLDPVSPYAVDSLGRTYTAIGRYDSAIEQYRSALALEPDFGLAHQDLGETYLDEGKCSAALEELRLAKESMPGARRMGRLAYAYAVCGHAAQARRILQEFLKPQQRDGVPALSIAEIYLGLGDKNQAFPWLEKAIDERDLGMHLKTDARFQPIRSDPRFQVLLRRMKLT